MKAKKFLVILTLLAIALFAVACNGDEDTTTKAPETDPPVVTTTATTTAKTTTAESTTATTTTKVTTKVTTTKVTTTVTTTTVTEPPKPVVPTPVIWDGTVANEFAGGTGTASDPYQIANGAQFALMAETAEKGEHYILVCDILLNDVFNFNSWGTLPNVPLNTWDSAWYTFEAHLDGNDKTIYGIYTDGGSGLFALVQDATIEDLTIAYAKISDIWTWEGEGEGDLPEVMTFDVGVIANTAIDTNLKNITVDYDTVYLNGVATNEEFAPLAVEIIMTLGSKPEVWGFEGLAVGALADGFIAENENYGTKFEVSIVDGKGFFEDEAEGKKALAWNSNDAGDQTLVLNYLNDASTVGRWDGVTEVLVYVDGSELPGDYEFGISLIDHTGTTWSIAEGATVAIQDGKAWTEQKTTEAGHISLAEGYCGYVRVAIADLTDGTDAELDLLAKGIQQLAFCYENAASAEAEGLFYIDSIRVTYEEPDNNVPTDIPTLGPAFGLTMLQDFEGDVAINIPEHHKVNVTAYTKGGMFNIEWLKNSGPDAGFGINKTITSDVKGFMIYIDATEVNPIDQRNGSGNPNSADGKYELYKQEYFGLYVTVGGKSYMIGTHGNLGQYSYIQSDDCGNWIKTYNINNNRICLPTHDYNGWMFLPVENFTEGGKANGASLADVLAASEEGLVLNSAMIFTNGDKNIPSILKLDNFYGVEGISVSEAPVVESAPATLPGDVEYVINDSMIDVDNDEFFRLWQASIADDKGVDASAALKFTTGANAIAANKTSKTAIVATSAGNHLMGGFDQSGIMMWVDLSEVTSADGKTVNFGIKSIVHWNEDIRMDSQAAFDSQGGNYWTFEIKSNLNFFGDEAYIYSDAEGSEWETVKISSANNSYVVPAGFTGYMYIPLNEFNRSNDTLFNSPQGFAYGYNYFRFFEIHIGNTVGNNESFYVDNMMIVAGEGFSAQQPATTEKTDKMPATLPEGKDYVLGVHFGFESEDDFLRIDRGNNSTYSFSADRAVSGNALTMVPGTGRAEFYVNTKNYVNIGGSCGVLFHIDFSDTVRDPDPNNKGIAASITINGNMYRANGGAKYGYYMADGTNEWVDTTPINSCRMGLPDGFKGWVYIPIDSYGGGGAANKGNTLYDSSKKVAFEYEQLDEMRIYTAGYVVDQDASVVIDDVIFVKAK